MPSGTVISSSRKHTLFLPPSQDINNNVILKIHGKYIKNQEIRTSPKAVTKFQSLNIYIKRGTHF